MLAAFANFLPLIESNTIKYANFLTRIMGAEIPYADRTWGLDKIFINMTGSKMEAKLDGNGLGVSLSRSTPCL